MSHRVKLWVQAEHRLGESIIWHAARGCYFWVDLLDPALFCHEPFAGTTVRHEIKLPPPVGSIAATADPDLLMLAHRGGLSLLDVRTMVLTSYCDPEGGRDAIIYNDIKVDRWGRLWVGTSHHRECEPRGALWCVESRNRWTLADAGFAISNGPAFSLDGRTLYFNDSAGRVTLAYDISPGSQLARNRRALIQHPEADGMPDGLVVDSNDHIWSAQWAGSCILKFDRDGRMLERFNVPSLHVTTLCFGGERLRHVAITTATDGVSPLQLAGFPLSGSLFHFESEAAGVPEPLFQL